MKNTTEQIRKKARFHAIAWLGSFLTVGTAFTGYRLYCAVVQNPFLAMRTPLYYAVFFIVTLVFYPWLYVVRRNAALAGWKTIKRIGTILICLFSVWILMAILFTILDLCGVPVS